MLRFQDPRKPLADTLFALIHKRKWVDVFKMLDQHPELANIREAAFPSAPSNSIVDYALFQGNIEIIARLRHYPGACQHPSPHTMEHLIQNKKWPLILHLIEHGWLTSNYIMPYRSSYRSILDWAKQDSDLVNTKTLIERYKAKTYQVLCAEAALFRAAEYDDWQSVFAFLDKSCVSVNARNAYHPNGWTLLNYAYFHGQPYAFLSLINEHQADLLLAIEACAGIQALISFQWNALQGTTASMESTADSEAADDFDAQKKHSAAQKKVASSTVPIAKSDSSMEAHSLVEKLEALQLESEQPVSSSIPAEAKDKSLVFSKSAQSSSEEWGLKALHIDFPPPEGGDPIVENNNHSRKNSNLSF
ncbi:hypothetical protein CC99x_006500 [Candidatus Berkiella cookevillensis]|uniref:Uncharacterized protein n=1 Tax=Candidatus Berkiella cookevillensis TaxID=437022 RepID=A0A0Q9YH13_9GAMM|nr:hypothetical protein [Candidatus Berkiella cookevillensis]MCS5708557.1 hypothetical protein [Candidatus Berkiella cookevillensis]